MSDKPTEPTTNGRGHSPEVMPGVAEPAATHILTHAIRVPIT